jgi:murein L,D-transpeptidase YcbB/YkuD
MCRAVGCVALVAVLTACGSGDVGAGARGSASAGLLPASTPSASPQPSIRFADDLVAAALQRFSAAGGGARIRGAKERTQLEALYPPGSAFPLWLDPAGRPTDSARDALALLVDCDAHGLDPDDYDAHALGDDAAALGANSPAEARARFDLSLSLHVLRYWRDLHLGRVAPRALGFRLNAPVDDHDFAAMLRAALAEHRLGAATSELVPPLVLYRSLVTALGHYREMASRSRPLTLPAPARSVKPGDRVEGLDSLRERLLLVGDLPPGTPAATDVYDGPLIDGVKHFQARHGLDADGAIGRSTFAALQVPLTTRVEQLALALERLRWLPHLDEDGFLAVNIPMFHLWGWGRVPPDGTPAFDMGVIVGRALNTQTPVFIDQIEHVIFRPYWNVPPSILRAETLPAIRKDPAYLARNDMEIVAGPGDDARAVPLSDASLALLGEGRLRVRQRPGPKNSLGLVKFVFPNDDNIYMHGTPARQLFSRARRDFSHGCIRLEDPVTLAEWVLRDQPEWTRDRILAAMEGPTSQLVKLTRPLQVILFYLTAVVLPQDGSVHFADDIYGHDGKLARALAERSEKSDVRGEK